MEIEDIKILIRTEFGKVRLGQGIGILEARALDDYGSSEQIAQARENDRAKWDSWEDISPLDIKKHYSALCFADPEGLRYLLPAYMLYALENLTNERSGTATDAAFDVLQDIEIYKEVAPLLSNNQSIAVRDFFTYMAYEHYKLDQGFPEIEAIIKFMQGSSEGT